MVCCQKPKSESDTVIGTAKPVNYRKQRVIAPKVGGAVMAGAVGVNVLSLGLPLVMLQIFDRVIPFQAMETLAVLVIGLLVAMALDFVLKCCRIVVMGHSAERFEVDLNDQAARSVLNAVSSHYQKGKAVERFEEISSVAQLRDHYGGQGRLLVIDLPFVAVFIALIWFVGGWLVAVPLVCFAALAGLSLVLRRYQADMFARRQVIDGRRYSFLAEFLERMVTIKANTMEEAMLRRYELLQDQSVNASRSLILLSGISQSFSAVINQAAVAAMGLLGGFLVIRGHIGIAELAACTLLNGRALQPMMKLTGIWVQAESISAAKTRMNNVLQLPQRRIFKDRKIRGVIAAHDATLHLEKREAPLFAGLSFRIEAGQCLAVTGADGAGKTSLLRMLLGEQTLTSGSILIDGAKPVDLGCARGAGGIVYVDAAPVIFQGSILRNIALSDDPGATRAAMATARAIGMNDAINHLPHGFETMIGPQSSGAYSRGFLQQIVLARALALGPKIMIFNEANTAMDRAADAAALKALAALSGTTTVVLVSRRPSYIALADTQVHVNGKESTVRSLRTIAPASLTYSFAGEKVRREGGGRPRPDVSSPGCVDDAKPHVSNQIVSTPERAMRGARARAAAKRAQKTQDRPKPSVAPSVPTTTRAVESVK